METGSSSFLEQLSTLWTKMNAGERLVVIASALILVIALMIWIGVTREPRYALLYGGLEATDAGMVINELQSRNVLYKVEDGGQSIMVPADQVAELRITLASDGFTPTGTAGYELLDKSPLGMSDFLQRQNRTRAIEGEIARTLMSLDEVSVARVHLTLPQPTPFIAEQVEPMASVVLKLSPPGMRLSGDRVAAVRTFVAGAIGSLAPDNVTIIDQNMNLLTGPVEARPSGLLPTQEEARRNYEIRRGAAIRSLLERRYGVGHVAVAFSCEMDFDEVESESLTYEPIAGSEHGILVSEELTETSATGEGYMPAVGIPGTESNIPSYPGAAGQPYESESSSETKNYEVSSTHEVRVQAPGTLKSCSVGVLIDSTDPKDPTKEREPLPGEKTEVEELIAAAAGLNTEQGDVLTVAFQPFDTRLEEELARAPLTIAGMHPLDFGLRVAIAFAVLLIFWTVLRNFLKPIERPFALPTVAAEEEEIEIELPPTDPEMLEKLRMREEIEKMIKEDPTAAAKVIKTWLRE